MSSIHQLLSGKGSGGVQQDFADEFEWEVGPDVWGEWWVCHFGIWLGGLGTVNLFDVWLVTTRRMAQVAYSLASQSQSQRYGG